MEQNPQILAKKAWSMLRIIFFMLKKTISKTRLFADLNMMMKRGKIAGKSLHNLLFHHHHHHWAATTFHHHLPYPTPPTSDDEFSCTTTPQHQNHVNNNNNNIITTIDHVKTLEMLTRVAASPGYRKSPVAKQLRITDSPFPLTNGDDGGQVDEDAEKFILRFYNGLKLEN
ncbi:hypothetical protein Hanom_Chr07g00582911 [Helianthus anomalus]